jgi:hypothetical protein
MLSLGKGLRKLATPFGICTWSMPSLAQSLKAPHFRYYNTFLGFCQCFNLAQDPFPKAPSASKFPSKSEDSFCPTRKGQRHATLVLGLS